MYTVMTELGNVVKYEDENGRVFYADYGEWVPCAAPGTLEQQQRWHPYSVLSKQKDMPVPGNR